ncbi:hypothetical protein CHS0354_018997 [Potamilus streckersoni]|uniref:Zinc transporter ZIP10 n=1 Tax=Potamilus streckersoni TaxID=2493646 RepID=A0AAE0VZG5_9BIVA|nr:hypothetical protein CHS0354_018997 [Potamilus streckersoni]
MCISPVFGVCLICLSFFRHFPCLPSPSTDDGRVIQSDKESITLSDHKETTQAINLKQTVIYGDYHSERKAIFTEKRNWFVQKLFEKYGSGETLSFEGFEHMLDHIRLQNIYFPDHNMTFDKDNSLVTFVSKYENQTSLLDASVYNKYKRDLSVSTHVYANDTEHHNTTFDQSYDNTNHYGNVVPVHNEDSSSGDLYKRSGMFPRHPEKVPLQEPYLQSNSSSINYTENVYHPSEIVHRLKHGRINKTSFKETNQSVIYHAIKVENEHDYNMENIEHINTKDSDMNINGNHAFYIQGDFSQKDIHNKRKEYTGDSDHHRQRNYSRAIENDAASKKCLTPRDIWKAYTFGVEEEITMSEFVDFCPALLYELDKCKVRDYSMATSFDPVGHHTKDDEDSPHEHDDMSRPIGYKMSEIPIKVWGFSCFAVVITSVIGLLGVVIIPIANEVLHNHLLNFLVSLAVGALMGDALLHLLPHALQITDDGHEELEGHDIGGVFKGLWCLGSIYLFFLAETFLTILTDFKKLQKKKKKQRLPGKYAHDGQTPVQDFREFAAVTDKESCTSTQDMSDQKSSKSRHQKHNHESNEEETLVMLDKSEFSRSHSHSHSHHSHEFPNSVAAIAWMVILGDGMHNLSDGLAIGAAFGASISSGFSTSIAVFCHELPHEIGDFAMLLKSGMSIKQAIFYNVVSSILSFIGMVIGITLGNITSASLWIFAVVAGMFLYIALVDMLPEIKNREHDGMVGKQLCDLFIHSAGMVIGAGIMLSIALYEDKIQIAFDSL